jgi:opacity protein-like surface antigen
MTNRTLLTALAAATLALAAHPANADKWSYAIEPYVIAVGIDGDVGIGRVNGADIDVDFDDILDSLQLGGMLHLEAHHENSWGFALDYVFMDLSKDKTGPRGGVVDADVFLGVFEALLIKGPGLGDEGLDYIAGLRWNSIEVDVDIDPVILPGTVSRNVDEDWVDVFVGARWKKQINDKWLFSLRGDVGAGGSDFTWQFITGFRYKLRDSMALDLGYRALGIDYETGTSGQPGYFKYDTTASGPLIGLVFKF